VIFKQLKFSDFLVFSGEQSLDLRSERDNSLVVILAPNNTGKTSVIRALKFLFYGDLADCNESTAHRLLNDRTRALCPSGSELVGYVQATVEFDGQALTVQRSIRARKSGKDQWLNPAIELSEVRIGGNTVLTPDRQGILQGRLTTMVPPTLFDAFYFKGEPLDGKLLGGVSGIRKSLESFLHEDAWQEAEKAAEAVRGQLTKELEKLTEKHAEYSKKLREEELIEDHLRKLSESEAQIREQLEVATIQWNEVSEALAQLGSASEAERQLSQLKLCSAQRDQARQARDRADAEIARTVGQSRGIPFLLGAIPIARRILSALRDDNILPADVSERFVERVLAAPKCVCGQVHTTDTREAWTRYKDKTLNVDLSRGLSDLLRAVEDQGSHSYAQLARTTALRLETLAEQRATACAELDQQERQIRELEAQLTNSPIEAIRGHTRKLGELANRRQHLQKELTSVEDNAQFIRKNLERVRTEKEKAKPAGAIAQKERQITKTRERAERLRLLIQNSRTVLKRSFHKILQDSVADYYNSTATDGSKARINSQDLLPKIESNGQIHGNLGGGQSQLLALAYIVSLARLRKTLHEQMVEIGIGLGKVDDQSFFLDSPFNHMTDHYAHAIARFLRGNARQVVLLMARHQWNLVREIIEPEMERVYAFQFRTLPSIYEDLKQKDASLGDSTYRVGKHSLTLVAPLPHGETHPTTTITLVS
jgi:DNA sulfur modification protein DndD